MKSRKGFTLVELLVVIAILAILATASIIGFTAFTRRAEVSNDSELVAQLNKYAQAATVSKDFKTVTEMRDELIESGFELANLKLDAEKQGYAIGFDVVKDRFVLLKGKEAAEGYTIENPLNVFVFVNNADDAETYGKGTVKYSLYLQNGFVGDSLAIETGLDVGEVSGITSISYTNSAAQEVVIRTNGGSLTINAANDKVTHYGVANKVDIQAVAPTSYVENGIVSIAKIKTGRIVVTPEAVLTSIHVVETNGNYDNIKVAVVGSAELPSFTRDEVTMNDGDKKLVIEIQSIATLAAVDESPEYIWISKTAGTTSTDVATSGETLNDETKVPVASQSTTAKAVATDAVEGTTAEQLAEMEAVATRYAGGQGTESNPYLLATKAHFGSIDEDYHDGVTAGKYYKLVADLDLGKIYPIGSMSLVGNNGSASQGYKITYSNTFQGNIDGGNHTISYSMIDDNGFASGTNVFGLFGAIENSTIKNLTIDADVNCERGSVWVGGIAGFAWNCNLENVTVNGSVVGSHDVGGFFGYYSNNGSASALFKNCILNADVVCNSKRTDSYAVMGGLIGQCVLSDCDSTLEFYNCVVNGDLSIENASSSNKSAAGYFIGFASDNGSNANKDIKFMFNLCSIGAESSLTSTLGYTKTVSNKTVWCGSSAEAIDSCPAIKYVGVTENAWSANLPMIKIYENNNLMDVSLYISE